LPDGVLVEAARALRTGDLGPRELLERCLERAAATAQLGAYAVLDVARARGQAAALAVQPWRGPLHGIPVAVKDSVDVAGLPTRAGSALTDATPAAADAPLVAALRAAGAVIVGKTATHPLTVGVTTPGTANPVDPARSPGGSSGGSAVAVAVGSALVAVGTDTAGSIRIPAALCGVAGIKARPAALPMRGMLGLAPSMDSAGLLAGGAEDLAAAWEALAAVRGGGAGVPTGDAWPGDAAAAGAGAPAAGAAALDLATPAGGAPALALAAPAPALERAAEPAWHAVLDALGRLPHVEVPDWEAWGRPRGRTLVAEALALHRGLGWWPSRAEEYPPQARSYLEYAERLSGDAVAAARAELDALAAALRAAVAAAGALLLPATPGPAPLRDDDPAAMLREDDRLCRICGPVNAAGLAAVAIPAGATADGLPVGIQLVAHDEATAFAAARAVAARLARVGAETPA
jgi:aspartyl-tRNA(Asn)/glutamyl-tRNA(Gln) amidotransferase subunit A